MNPHIQLYQFLRDGDRIAITRISVVEIKPGPRDGQESVRLDLRVEENLVDAGSQSNYSFVFDRPAYENARLKFPDPVWGRVDLRSGAEVLLVTPPGPASAATQNLVYAEGIPNPADPVLRSIREVLSAERSRQSDVDRFDRRLGWLASGDIVQKLFAGETLAKDRNSGDQTSRLIPAFARAFAGEQDPYTKISLGSWLWHDIYPRAANEDDCIAIVNATIGAASSESLNVRHFAIDRLSEVDPGLLGKPRIQASLEVITQLEDRRRTESDARVQDSLGRIIEALRRR
jgi:hypothetical protein